MAITTEIEVAYRIPGNPWKRKVCKSHASFQAWFAKLEAKHGECIETRFAN